MGIIELHIRNIFQRTCH